MNYHDYVTIHTISFVLMVTNLILYSNNTKVNTYKIMGILSFILTGVSGIILSFRFGLEGEFAFPKWLIIKYAIWISMGFITLLLTFKFKEKISKLYWPWLLLTAISIIFSIYKPL